LDVEPGDESAPDESDAEGLGRLCHDVARVSDFEVGKSTLSVTAVYSALDELLTGR
jgi:hypothetical protein